ncbi:cholesterol oxidase substrate-binding domain-containing protein [Streptomyces johnsoniae]|uniref:Cholesterol oxidase substrate-binding domain-containing protein n=1 Tax=Streptomyces johnsoniae TaxID=3075532 RepID=A0ABU2S9J3_9ACTN|nr:cholesterol oxidase substrate-binding domain-containing protein [Streptomyces sp. DSM 41886]MDT0444770.1 cholesterol oxidase substrate-binding domain-containing protein [Streptomyces sp. DSM 41886]
MPTSPELPSRRGVLRTAAAAGALGLTAHAATARAAAEIPAPALPGGLHPYRSPYLNWAGEIAHPGLWTCAPSDGQQIADLANWARAAGWRLRARGKAHTWSPLTITPGTDVDARVLLVDTTTHLTATELATPPAGVPGAVHAQTGVTLEALLGFLADHGLGVTNTPAPGELTLGGTLAIDAHGTSVPAEGEAARPGHTYGSLSNLVLELTAVVWDAASGRYVLRTFTRGADAACDVLAAHLGRGFVVEAVLQAGEESAMRCVSRVDVPADELFAAPGSEAAAGGCTFADFLATAGRVETIWFAFTDRPWLKVWSLSPQRPATSRPVTGPYNYPFSDSVPTVVSRLAGRLVADAAWYLAPELGALQYTVAASGLTATLSKDLWGASHHLMFYLRPTTLRETANGYAILTRRADVQRVISEFAGFYRERLAAWARNGRFPVNGQVEIRVGGLDQPVDVAVPGARPPLLSVVRPHQDHPEFDCAVWVDVLTLPGTPGAPEFYRELERFCLAAFDGGHALVRVEWSKGWGYTDTAAWADREVIHSVVPASFGTAQWAEGTRLLHELDPHGVFGNTFLDALLAP